MSKIKERADTAGKKRAVLERLLIAWGMYPDLRLSQLIVNVFGKYDIYHIEDFDLVEKIEDWVAKNKVAEIIKEEARGGSREIS